MMVVRRDKVLALEAAVYSDFETGGQCANMPSSTFARIANRLLTHHFGGDFTDASSLMKRRIAG
jgi:hypothetical protein